MCVCSQGDVNLNTANNVVLPWRPHSLINGAFVQIRRCDLVVFVKGRDFDLTRQRTKRGHIELIESTSQEFKCPCVSFEYFCELLFLFRN